MITTNLKYHEDQATCQRKRNAERQSQKLARPSEGSGFVPEGRSAVYFKQDDNHGIGTINMLEVVYE
jgi:hypothetical protein